MKKTTISPYRHLNLSDRVTIYSLKKQGKSLRDIAQEIDRDVGTISRELKRNKSRVDLEYFPVKAHDNFVKRALRQRTKAPLKNPETTKGSEVSILGGISLSFSFLISGNSFLIKLTKGLLVNLNW